ncbi:hypothetical protein COF68_05800 [Bacillus toyonensis]|uniref:hypothetical protein n=1 Tax=Bacillus toyonensis TaxID=155322 RepID=UPI000BFBFCE5|nr:hypothetical protein [Bacillus toyonensis]PHE64354.1 hypothetical protein COF68_05800 [Bacillus toyonensis]
MLRATDNKGFVLTFENGVTISVQFGYNNYCEVRDVERNFGDSMLTPIHESKTAEILIETSDGKIITDEFARKFGLDSDGQYLGWINSDDVARAIFWAKTYNCKFQYKDSKDANESVRQPSVTRLLSDILEGKSTINLDVPIYSESKKTKHKQLHSPKVVNVPFVFKRLSDVTNGTISVDGRPVLVFDPISGREQEIPSGSNGGYLALSSLDKMEREHFFFNSEHDVQKMVTGIGLRNNLLIVQINDMYMERKTQITFFAPSWLIEMYAK